MNIHVCKRSTESRDRWTPRAVQTTILNWHSEFPDQRDPAAMEEDMMSCPDLCMCIPAYWHGHTTTQRDTYTHSTRIKILSDMINFLKLQCVSIPVIWKASKQSQQQRLAFAGQDLHTVREWKWGQPLQKPMHRALLKLRTGPPWDPAVPGSTVTDPRSACHRGI